MDAREEDGANPDPDLHPHPHPHPHLDLDLDLDLESLAPPAHTFTPFCGSVEVVLTPYDIYEVHPLPDHAALLHYMGGTPPGGHFVTPGAVALIGMIKTLKTLTATRPGTAMGAIAIFNAPRVDDAPYLSELGALWRHVASGAGHGEPVCHRTAMSDADRASWWASEVTTTLQDMEDIIMRLYGSAPDPGTTMRRTHAFGTHDTAEAFAVALQLACVTGRPCAEAWAETPLRCAITADWAPVSAPDGYLAWRCGSGVARVLDGGRWGAIGIIAVDDDVQWRVLTAPASVDVDTASAVLAGSAIAAPDIAGAAGLAIPAWEVLMADVIDMKQCVAAPNISVCTAIRASLVFGSCGKRAASTRPRPPRHDGTLHVVGSHGVAVVGRFYRGVPMATFVIQLDAPGRRVVSPVVWRAASTRPSPARGFSESWAAALRPVAFRD